jgi:hypothetical protein
MVDIEIEWYEYCLNNGLIDNKHVLKDMPIYIIRDIYEKYNNSNTIETQRYNTSLILDWCELTKVKSNDLILNNLDLPWSLHDITVNSIPIEIVLNNLNRNWNLTTIDYSLLSWDRINKYLNNDWDWRKMHLVNGVDLNIIKSIPNKGWYYTAIVIKFIDVITIEDLFELDDKYVDWNLVSYHINNRFDIVNMFYYKNWLWDVVSSRIKFDNAIKYPRLPWNWSVISKNITFNECINHPELPWDWSVISIKATWDDYICYPNLPWDLNYLSKNNNISFNNLKTLPDWEKNKREFYRNKCIQVDKDEFIRKRMMKRFIRKITEELVKTVLHPDKLNKFMEMGYTPYEFNHIYGNQS